MVDAGSFTGSSRDILWCNAVTLYRRSRLLVHRLDNDVLYLQPDKRALVNGITVHHLLCNMYRDSRDMGWYLEYYPGKRVCV